ncbi:MAG TPA: isoprenylcysteine carboxylmethyltransferase family protein [Gemmatimonadaceae bacterium]|nr:isoprenylcysteine carboxylmethyltransferase family protein [Gemmatimonadaceae bacterium]
MTRAKIGRMLALIPIVIFSGIIGAAVATSSATIETQRTRISLILWAAFFIIWSIAGRNSAPSQRSESWGSTYIHQTALIAALMLLFVQAPGLTGFFLPESFRPAVVIGVIVQCAFLLFAFWARWHLGRNWAAEVRIGEGHELVRTGPYRWVRHPIYTAMLGMFVGTAIASGQYHALLGVVILFVAYIRKTRLEEEILSRTFPTDYEAYRRSTWRLVPPVF